MKDYSLLVGNLDETKDFILKYKINDDGVLEKEIVVYYNGFRKKIFPYTKEKEKEILNQMREQFMKYRFGMEDVLWKEKQTKRLYERGVEISSIITFFGSLFVFGQDDTLSNNGKLFLTLGILGLVVSVPSLITNKIIIDDYKKSKLFLEKEKLIKEILINDGEILNKVKKCLKDMAINNEEDEVEINLNFIDKLSLKQLKNLVYIIEKEINIRLINDTIENEKKLQYKKS